MSSKLKNSPPSKYTRVDMEQDLAVFREPFVQSMLDNPENGSFGYCETELVWGWNWSEVGYNRIKEWAMDLPRAPGDSWL